MGTENEILFCVSKKRWKRQGFVRTVARRDPYTKKHTVQQRRRLVRLVYGTKKGSGGNRCSRHSIRAAIDIVNIEEKGAALNFATAHRILTDADLVARIPRVGPGINQINNDARRAFHHLRGAWTPLQWQSIVFTDAHTLSPNHLNNPHNEQVWVKRGERPAPLRKVRRHDARTQPTLHVYGAVSRYGFCGPFFVEGKLNSDIYQRDVLTPMLPAIASKFPAGEQWTFQQDGAGEHRSKSTQDFLRKSGYSFWDYTLWPGNSADINCIEGFWSLLQEAVTPVGVYGLTNRQMRRRATLWFSRVTIPQCRKALSSMVARMAALPVADFWSIPD